LVTRRWYEREQTPTQRNNVDGRDAGSVGESSRGGGRRPLAAVAVAVLQLLLLYLSTDAHVMLPLAPAPQQHRCDEGEPDTNRQLREHRSAQLPTLPLHATRQTIAVNNIAGAQQQRPHTGGVV
jgi:hypothetical protein